MIEDELEILKASYDSSEFIYVISNKSPIYKFHLQNNVSVTFELPPAYPQKPPGISITAANMTNASRSTFENELRSYASENIGNLMIMDLVIKLQQFISDYEKNFLESRSRNTVDVKKEDTYLAVILIDHMRQKKKYCNLLTSWVSELNIFGCLLFYKKWIFLLLQGSKKHVKEFITRHKTVCIDVDSTGKPCKEKMSKILFEEFSTGNVSKFFVKEMTSIEEMENYFIESNIIRVYKDVIQPMLNGNKSCH